MSIVFVVNSLLLLSAVHPLHRLDATSSAADAGDAMKAADQDEERGDQQVFGNGGDCQKFIAKNLVVAGHCHSQRAYK